LNPYYRNAYQKKNTYFCVQIFKILATNLQIKFIKSLHLKKNREENKLFLCEGTKIVAELLTQSQFIIKEIYALKKWIDNNEISNQNVIEVTPKQMEQLSTLKTPSEVLAVVNFPKIDTFKNEWLTLYLDEIKDPGNLGTIIRTAEWYGVNSIILSPNCVEWFSPKVVQATMGSIFRVQPYYDTLESFIAKNAFSNIYGAYLEGNSIYEEPFTHNSLLVIGSESHGIHPSHFELINKKITIPSFGNAESLNASIATSIIVDNFKRMAIQ
jgi:TrmH family RNA methyltransferase